MLSESRKLLKSVKLAPKQKMDNAGAEESPGNLSEIQGLLKTLLDNDNPQLINELVDETLNILRKLPSDKTTQLSCPSGSINQLHGMGIALWNKAVTLKAAAAITLDINAQLRHVAFTTVLVCNLSEVSFQQTIKYITMALKTARAWLDCDNHEMAETSLQLANQYWERMGSRYPSEAESSDSLRLLFKILCSQIESALGVLNEDKAMELITKTKDILRILDDKESVHLTVLCYNLGLQQFQREKYPSSVELLKQSYDIGRSCNSENMATKQARTLRLLAASYLELDGQAHWQKALNAIGLANSEHSHPAGLLLKNRIMLQYMPHVDDRINAAMEDILNHPDTTMDIRISAVRETHNNGRLDLAIDALQALKQRTKISLDREKLEQLHLELLLESNRMDEAKNLVQSYIKAHDSGDIMNTQATQNFNTLLWDQGSKAYENKDFSRALEWYQYSLVLLSMSDSPLNQDAAKLQRNCSSCYIELKEYAKAEEMVKQAVENDSNSSHSCFLLFKISILLDKEDQAKSALQVMIECSKWSEDIPSFLALAAQMAFERNNSSLAAVALEYIIRNPQNSTHALTSLRCLIRMKMSLLSPDTTESTNLSLLRSILGYINMAEQHISNLSGALKESEAAWFMKISWNTGIQANEAFQEVSEAFEACRKFCSVLSNDQTNYSRQKTCLLMVTSASLQLARNTNEIAEKTMLMESVLTRVKQYQEVSSMCDSISPSDPTPSLVLLYQLEAQLYLGTMSSSNEIMAMISSLPQIEPKIYETVAGLIVQNPPKEGGAVIAQNALKAAIKLHSESAKPNPERLSRCSHSLIQLLIGRESSSDMVSKERAMTVLKNTLKFLKDSTGAGFPETEILWHMVKAWNTGIHLYSVLRFKEAEAWCSLSMKFLPHLPPNLMETYCSRMTGIYDEILGQVDSHAGIQ